MKPITVLIVDDSAVIRTLLSDLLADAADITVISTAQNAQQAREEIKRLNPDVLTLDIEMPGMDGLSFLEKIMSLRPMPVIMISTLTQKGALATLRALETGAVDYFPKPINLHAEAAWAQMKQELAEKIRIAARTNLTRYGARTEPSAQVVPFRPIANMPLPVIAMGSSTGGVEALRDIFKLLPRNCPPIVMTQHMPEQFTAALAARLNSLSEVEVAEATEGKLLQPGHAYLAPGGYQHLKIVKKGPAFICKLEASAPVSGHCPSVDILFDSVADAAGANAVGIILTGMGKDGAAGLLKMHRAGAYTIGQGEHSCVVYGMPKAAMQLGAVDNEVALADIAAHMISHLETKVNSHAS